MRHVWKHPRYGYVDYCRNCGVSRSEVRRFRRVHKIKRLCIRRGYR